MANLHTVIPVVFPTARTCPGKAASIPQMKDGGPGIDSALPKQQTDVPIIVFTALIGMGVFNFKAAYIADTRPKKLPDGKHRLTHCLLAIGIRAVS